MGEREREREREGNRGGGGRGGEKGGRELGPGEGGVAENLPDESTATLFLRKNFIMKLI